MGSNRAKGIPVEDAERFAAQVMRDPDVALDLMAREELGLNPDELGSPVAVAFSSMAAFGSGAIVPVLPFLFLPVATAAPVAAVLTVIALLLTGGLTARKIGRPPLRGAVRLAFLGAAAALITYVAGRIAGGIANSLAPPTRSVGAIRIRRAAKVVIPTAGTDVAKGRC